jgi:hypothetical protein
VNLTEAIRLLLRQHPAGLSPAQMVGVIKLEIPHLYATEQHREWLAKRSVTSLDHALKAEIYWQYPKIEGVEADKTVRPMRLYLADESIEQTSLPTLPKAKSLDDLDVPEMSEETIAKLEADVGNLYVLATQTYTKDGSEILKIGITAGSVEQRIKQLYTTSAVVPFRVVLQLETCSYADLEKGLHHLLAPFRINRSREYFADTCLPFVEAILKIHNEIHSQRREGPAVAEV